MDINNVIRMGRANISYSGHVTGLNFENMKWEVPYNLQLEFPQGEGKKSRW